MDAKQPLDIAVAPEADAVMTLVRIHYKNNTDKMFDLEKMNYPSGSSASKVLLQVEDSAGQRVRYVGPRVKLPGSGPNDYFEIKPGETMEGVLRIDKLYTLRDPKGIVRVRYFAYNVHRNEKRLDELASEWVELKVPR